jgi:hypothetical protein
MCLTSQKARAADERRLARVQFSEAVFGHRETLSDLTAGSTSRNQHSIRLKDVS